MHVENEHDVPLMRRAIHLSKRGFPAPNPHVGCVLAHGAEVVGEGFHRYAGSFHAEVEALRQAGNRAAGSTAYVTLEPCSHHGRTPPCADALIAAHVSRVVFACEDPNPNAAGGKVKLLGAGLSVLSGLLQEEAATANDQFLTAMKLKRPRIVLKAAMSLDGRIALPNGESRWITGADSRKRAHKLRAECGAVLVGRRTVEADNPQLTARIPGVVNQPVRVVLDPSRKLDAGWKVFDDSAHTLHVVDGSFGLRAGPDGFDLRDLSKALFAAAGLTGLLVEGGAKTLSGFIRAGLADCIELFVAPKIIGAGPSWVGDLDVQRLLDAPEYRIVSLRKLKADIHISLRSKLGNFEDVITDIDF